MQQERDDLDNLIFRSIDKITISNDYNEKLILKLNDRNENNVVNKYLYKNSAAALSLIVSGLLFILVNTTNLNSTLSNLNYKVKTQFLAVEYEYNYKIENIKINLGGDY